MSIKRMTEQALLEGLDAEGAHADELVEPLPQELEPLERLRGEQGGFGYAGKVVSTSKSDGK
jgi:antitoxin VapB